MSRELRFPRSVYSGEAIDQALKTWAAYLDVEQRESPEHWIVALTVKPEYQAHARRIIGEFGNTALGHTIDRGGAQ